MKNHLDAIIGPANEATPWKPWLKFKRAAAYLGLPSTEMYEFAATSRQDRPQPSTNCQGGNAGMPKTCSSPMTKVHPTNPP